MQFKECQSAYGKGYDPVGPRPEIANGEIHAAMHHDGECHSLDARERVLEGRKFMILPVQCGKGRDHGEGGQYEACEGCQHAGHTA